MDSLTGSQGKLQELRSGSPLICFHSTIAPKPPGASSPSAGILNLKAIPLSKLARHTPANWLEAAYPGECRLAPKKPRLRSERRPRSQGIRGPDSRQQRQPTQHRQAISPKPYSSHSNRNPRRERDIRAKPLRRLSRTPIAQNSHTKRGGKNPTPLFSQTYSANYSALMRMP